MTKTKARARAKARAAAARAAKPGGKAEKPESSVPSGNFDAKSNTMRNMSGASYNNTAGVRRGSARSR